MRHFDHITPEGIWVTLIPAPWWDHSGRLPIEFEPHQWYPRNRRPEPPHPEAQEYIRKFLERLEFLEKMVVKK